MTRPVLRRPSPFAVLALVAVVVVLGDLAASRAAGFLGFPLDDAWIYQAYARTLGERAEFAFLPGQPSAGSTSPAWSALLAAGYLLRAPHLAWAYLLGTILLALNAWLAYRLVRALWPEQPAAAWAAGVLVAAEWHLAWAAASGMETLLFAAVVLLALLLDPARRPLQVGLAAGAAALARPDGLLLLPFLVALALLNPAAWVARLRAAAWLALGAAIVFGPYLAFNAYLSGSLWPNTFYAKQAEYAVLRELPLWLRLARVGAEPFKGPLVLLAPGVAVAAWQAMRQRAWRPLALLAWAAAMIGAYALRLPVTYQHGRYQIPTIPVLIVLGVAGLAQILHPNSARPAVRVIARAGWVSTALLATAFLVLGASAYARDVRIIETEMVAAARWVDAHTEPGARVAAHDIGALGYFGHRPVLDLAGLVAPDVIPFIRDEDRLAAWLDVARADYLMTFPGWYPQLAGRLAGAKLYATGSPFSPAAGGENMAIYRWRPTP